MQEFYDAIFKRLSIRAFDPELKLSDEELDGIRKAMDAVKPLCPDIPVKLQLVKREETSAKWGEYCIVAYSEKRDGYLTNIGYMIEQLDLYFGLNNFGACWYGLAKPEEKQLDGLDFVIVIAFGKSRPEEFRNDVSQFKRHEREEIWNGIFDDEVVEGVRLAPSACNTQPWRITSENGVLTIRRAKGLTSFLRGDLLSYFNAIDMGICLCCLEAGLERKGIAFERTLFNEEIEDKVAEYKTDF